MMVAILHYKPIIVCATALKERTWSGWQLPEEFVKKLMENYCETRLRWV